MLKINLKDKKYLLLSIVMLVLTLGRLGIFKNKNSESMDLISRLEELKMDVDSFKLLPLSKPQLDSCFVHQHTTGSLHKREKEILSALNKIDNRFESAFFYWDTVLLDYDVYLYFDILMFTGNEELYNSRNLDYLNDSWIGFVSHSNLAHEVVVKNSNTKETKCKQPMIYYVFDSITLYEVGTVKYEIMTYKTMGFSLSESMKETRSYYMKTEELIRVFRESKNKNDFMNKLEKYDYTKNF